jgi:hypothetical protein
VVSGTARFTVGKIDHQAPAGTLRRPPPIFHDPGKVRRRPAAVGGGPATVRRQSPSGLTTVSTNSPIAASTAPGCSIWGKCPASGMSLKWLLGKAAAYARP